MSQYQIYSLVTSSSYPYAGIINQGQTYVPVQLDAGLDGDDIWTITPSPYEDPDVPVQFKIGNLAYTGVDDQNAVIVSNDPTRDVKWYNTWQPNCAGYTIERSPGVGWKVSNSLNTAPIVVDTLDTSQCDSYVLFNFTKAN